MLSVPGAPDEGRISSTKHVTRLDRPTLASIGARFSLTYGSHDRHASLPSRQAEKNAMRRATALAKRQRNVRVAAGDRLGKTPPPATQAARGCMVTQRAAEKSAPQHFVVVPIIIDHQLQLLVGAWLAADMPPFDRPLAIAAAPSWRGFEGTRSLGLAPNNPG